MLKSLWSGLTGLSASQKALDVESNNIANANTNGFKYSKIAFEDLLSQTYTTSSAPGGSLGGVNAQQIGLGVKVSSIDKVFSQGSIESTDTVTDLAIQGQGFFIASKNNGVDNYYTRDGEMKFDSTGTLVNSNGYKMLGWEAEPDTFVVNSSNKLENITVDPLMTIPAKATEFLGLQGNLNNSNSIKESLPSSHPYEKYTDFNELYNTDGQKLKVKDGNTLDITLFDAAGNPSTTTIQYNVDFTSMGDVIDYINKQLRDPTGEDRTRRVYLDGKGRLVDNYNLIDTITSTNNPSLTNLFAPLASSRSSEPAKIDKNNYMSSDDVGELFNADGEKIGLKAGDGVSINIEGLKENRNFVYRDKDMTSVQERYNLDGDYQLNSDLDAASADEGFHWTQNNTGDTANLNAGDTITVDYQDPAAPGPVTQSLTFTYGTDFASMSDLAFVVNDGLPQGSTGFLEVDANGGKINKIGNFIKNITVTSGLDGAGNPTRDITQPNGLSRFANLMTPLATTLSTGDFYMNNTYYFSDMQNLENLLQLSIDEAGDPVVNPVAQSGRVSLDDKGQIVVKNTGQKSFGINVVGYPDSEHENKNFSNIMMGLNALSVPGNNVHSRMLKTASHNISTDIYDNFGNTHALDISLVKAETQNDNGFIVWKWKADMASPALLTGTTYGEVRFSPDGALYSYTPSTLTFMSSDGKLGVPNTFNLDFGKIGELNGLTSQELPSKTKKVTQDGYAGGELTDIRIDKNGYINGTFSNGQAKKLAQIGMANFTNPAGLENVGGNLYRQSANTSEPDIGVAGSARFGEVLSSSLEKSNVDLSTALVNMIIFQRGFSANAKTITTADEVLKELIGLKR